MYEDHNAPAKGTHSIRTLEQVLAYVKDLPTGDTEKLHKLTLFKSRRNDPIHRVRTPKIHRIGR